MQTPDVIIINHPTGGIVIVADPRVDDAQVAQVVEYVQRRAELHPERLTTASYNCPVDVTLPEYLEGVDVLCYDPIPIPPQRSPGPVPLRVIPSRRR